MMSVEPCRSSAGTLPSRSSTSPSLSHSHSHSLSLPSLDELVLNYFLIEGFQSLAEVFQQETETKGKRKGTSEERKKEEGRHTT